MEGLINVARGAHSCISAALRRSPLDAMSSTPIPPASRPHSSYQRPASAVTAPHRRVPQRPASAYPNAPIAAQPASRPMTATKAASASSSAVSRAPAFMLDHSGKLRQTATGIIADADLQTTDENLRALFARYSQPITSRAEAADREQHESKAAVTRAVTVGGTSRPAQVLRPSSARATVIRPRSATDNGFPSRIQKQSMSAAGLASSEFPNEHSSAFGRTVYMGATTSDREYGLPTGRVPTIAIDGDSDEDEHLDSDSHRAAKDNAEQRALRLKGYPQIDAIPYPKNVVVVPVEESKTGYAPGTIPPSAFASASTPKKKAILKATFTDLGVHLRSKSKADPMQSWKEAAETRSIPLSLDREQHFLHSQRDHLHAIEMLRRKHSKEASRKRSLLEERDRPWRAHDAMNEDDRWTRQVHLHQVSQLERNLDDMLKLWRERRLEKNIEELQQRPEKQHRRNEETGEIETQIPPPDPSKNDMLYRLLSALESQMAELQVYDEIFHAITRPDKTNPEETSASVICPSAPLCDLLDRIRVAHASFYPQFSELFSEVRRRLKFDWLLDEMKRRKDHTMEKVKGDVEQWEEELTSEQRRSQAHSDELYRTQTTLKSHREQAFFEAPPSKPTMVYDANERKLIHLTSQDEITRLQAAPTLWYGEQSASESDLGSDDAAAAAMLRRKSGRKEKKSHLERENSMGTIAWRNERAQRKIVKIQERLKLRQQQRQQEAEWRGKRITELRVIGKSSGTGLSSELQTELFHLLDEAEQARLRTANGEDAKIEVSESESPDESTSSADSGEDLAASAAAKQRRQARLSLLTPDQRKKKLLARVSRNVVRAFTTRPLLHIRPLTSGDKVGGKVFLNSDYFVFELGEADPGVWIRLFATEAGTQENHIELQLAYGAPPTKGRRFFTTTTQDSVTHTSIDLRSFEMRRAREDHEARINRAIVDAGGEPKKSTGDGIKKSPARWYLRVVGRGFSMKAYALEFRIHTALIDYSRLLGDALSDLETQSRWQSTLNDKALVLDQLAHELMPKRPTKTFAEARLAEMEDEAQLMLPYSAESASIFEERTFQEEDGHTEPQRR